MVTRKQMDLYYEDLKTLRDLKSNFHLYGIGEPDEDFTRDAAIYINLAISKLECYQHDLKD